MTAGVPVQYIEWFASTGKRKVNKSKDSKGKGVDREKKEKTDPSPPKKNTYADMSVPGGRLVRSSRKKESGKGTRTIELRNSGGILGW